MAILKKYEEKDFFKIKKSYELMSNRGPDMGNLYINPSYILGFKRLSIMDNSEKGNQPFSIGKTKLICNGEIYNYKELMEEYNIKCVSQSDCEVILHLYKKIGFVKTINLLNGDFAIILIDEDTVYFATDKIGVRPLFVGTTYSGNLSLASYARVLMDYSYDIRLLEPCIYAYNFKTDFFNIIPYNYTIKKTVLPPTEQKSVINKILIDSVKQRIIADRPIGCLLSGGLDSSLIVSILCKIIGPENVNTFSIGMKNSKDLFYAKKVSEFLGTNHTEVLFTAEEGISVIPDVIKDLETYDITTVRASVPMWLLCKHISKNTNIKVLLSGEGSDELFCGYLYFHYAPNDIELDKESINLIKNLYLYDVLRADRCVSSHGLELRVPFLDKNFIDLILSLEPKYKKPIDGIEKHLLRKSFEDGYLPEDVLWRTKDGLSDGVSGKEKSWYQYIEDYADKNVILLDNFPSKESVYYYNIFNKIFFNYKTKSKYWLPKWVNHNGNPSGRILEVYKHT